MNVGGPAFREAICGRLRRATSELRDLQQLLVLEGIDLRVLLDFREAVDGVRHVAWSVQQWLEARESNQDKSPVLTYLAAYRVRIATQLATDIAGSLEQGEIPRDFAGAEKLQSATRRLLKTLEN